MQALLDVILLQDGVFELHLGVLLVELLANIGIAYRRAAGNQRLQFAEENFFAYGIFEVGRSQIMLLQHRLVFRLANEVTAGKKISA